MLSSSPSTTLSATTRTFTSLRIQSTSRLAAQRSSFIPLQRRFASDEAAATQSELEADGAAEPQYNDTSATAAAEADIVVDEPLKTEKEAAAETPAAAEGSSGGIVSEAAASVAGTAAAVGETLSGAAGFNRSDASSSGLRGSGEAVEPTKNVYVGNLFFDVGPEDLKREFEQAGPVVDSKIVKDTRGLSKGYVRSSFCLVNCHIHSGIT